MMPFDPIEKEGVLTPDERKPEQAAAQRIEIEPVANESVLLPNMEHQSHS
jgi:hypothetical protein